MWEAEWVQEWEDSLVSELDLTSVLELVKELEKMLVPAWGKGKEQMWES